MGSGKETLMIEQYNIPFEAEVLPLFIGVFRAVSVAFLLSMIAAGKKSGNS